MEHASLLALPPGAARRRVLDHGSGAGQLAHYLATQGVAEVVGVDCYARTRVIGSAAAMCYPGFACRSRTCSTEPPASVAFSACQWMRRSEAAWTLGCTPMSAFMRVVLPLAIPAIAAASIFTFVLSWNEVFAASILTVQNRTLPAQVLASRSESPLPYRFAGGFASSRRWTRSAGCVPQTG